MNLKNQVLKYPILSSIIVMFLVSLLTEVKINAFFEKYFNNQISNYLQGIVMQGLATIIIVIFIFYLGIQEEAKIKKFKEWKNLVLFWPLLLISAVMFFEYISVSTGIKQDFFLIIVYILLFISTGFVEETIFRGFITTLFIKKWGNSKKGIYFSVIIASSIFGILHLFNLFSGRADLIYSLSQLIYSAVFGIIFATCMLRNDSIWPVIIVHAIFDLVACLGQIDNNSTFDLTKDLTWNVFIFNLVLSVPLLIYGLFILRKVESNVYKK
ncbi:MAG: CPBP family intramembrane glutamic endopeptidase [Clostridiales bacterium]